MVFFQFTFLCFLNAWNLPVSQRRDDKPFSAAQKFILVDKTYVCDADNHFVGVLIEVETTLLQPLKVSWAFDMQLALRKKKWTRKKEDK